MSAAIARMAVVPADVTKIFLTHLHSDHVVGLSELYLFPWASQGRSTPLQVWGPDGTKAMTEHLQQAFAFGIHIRRDVDEKFSADGIKVVASDRAACLGGITAAVASAEPLLAVPTSAALA